MFTCLLRRHVVSTEGADSVGGEIGREQECPFSGVINLGSLAEDALKRDLEYGLGAWMREFKLLK